MHGIDLHLSMAWLQEIVRYLMQSFWVTQCFEKGDANELIAILSHTAVAEERNMSDGWSKAEHVKI